MAKLGIIIVYFSKPMYNLSAAKCMASAPKLHSILLLAQLTLVVTVVPAEWKSCETAALAEPDTAIRS